MRVVGTMISRSLAERQWTMTGIARERFSRFGVGSCWVREASGVRSKDSPFAMALAESVMNPTFPISANVQKMLTPQTLERPVSLFPFRVLHAPGLLVLFVDFKSIFLLF